jgi:hypothetical protein
VIASIVELVLALGCIFIAGHIVIRLLDAQRDSGRRDE